jgi:predicted nucleic acid-binding protein
LAYGCDGFLSEDLTHGQHIGGLRIINPFVDESVTFLKPD